MKVKNNLSRMLGDIWNGRKQIEKLSTKALELNGENVVLHQLREGTPVNAVAASGTLTFTGAIAFGDTVTIGADVYEFVEKAEDVTKGNIAIVTTESETAANLALALIANTDGVEDVTLATGGTGVVTVTAKTKGVLANAIKTSTTVTDNASFAKATLQGGVDGTVGKKNEVYYNGTNLYIATLDNKITDTNWKYVAVSLT